jgi:hypothetical protein
VKKIALLLTSLGLVGAGIAILATAQEPAPPAFERGDSKVGAGEQDDARETDEEGGDFNEDRPKQIQVQVEFIEMSHETMTKLLYKAKPTSADATKLREQLQEMVEKKEASVFETMILIARSGQKASTESIHEFIYPTEYEPPSICWEGAEKNQPKTTLPPLPTAFEPRNLGSMLEIEPTLGSDDQIIDLRLAPEIAWHTGNISWMKGKDGAGADYEVTMPGFYILRKTFSMSCSNGKYHFVGAHSPQDEKGNTDPKRKMLVFVKCDVLVVK